MSGKPSAADGSASASTAAKQPPAALLARLQAKQATKSAVAADPQAAVAAAQARVASASSAAAAAGYSHAKTTVTTVDGISTITADGSAMAMTNAPQAVPAEVASGAVPTAAKRKAPVPSEVKSDAPAPAVVNTGGQHHFPVAAIKDNQFLQSHGEKLLLNQYWFSSDTLAMMVAEACEFGSRIACLSTPSVYFSLPPNVRAGAKVFDIDTTFATDPGFVEWSYKSDPATALPAAFKGAFDYVIIDPPFISEKVWAQYATTAKWLLVDGDELDAPGDGVVPAADSASAADAKSAPVVRVETPYGIGVVRDPPQRAGATSLALNREGLLTVELSWGAVAHLSPEVVKLAKPFRVDTVYGVAKVLAPPQNTANVITFDADGLISVEFQWGARARINADAIRRSTGAAGTTGTASGVVPPTPRGKLLLSTIPENDWVMRELLGCAMCTFRPSIPTLIYQYSFFANYPSKRLAAFNPEIDPQ